MIIANPGATILLSYQAEDKNTGLTISCSIYKNDNTVLSTPTISHVSNGLYQGTTTISDENTYTAVFTPNDTNYSTEAVSISVHRSWRPSFGREAKVDFTPIEKALAKLEEGQDKLREELDKKSEFDPNKQKVLTSIKIPAVSLRPVREDIGNLKTAIQQVAKVRDYTNQINQIKSQIIKEIQTSKPDLAIVLDGINKLDKGQLENKEDRNRLVQAITNLADKQALAQRDIKNIPRTDLRENVNQIITFLTSLKPAKPDDIVRLNTLVSQFQTQSQQSIETIGQLLEALNQQLGRMLFNIESRINKMETQLVRINSFKQDNKNILDKLDNLQ